jgi:hypothetical protein
MHRTICNFGEAMNAIERRRSRELDFYDWDSLGEALEAVEIDRMAAEYAPALPGSDDIVPYRANRVIEYAGAAGVMTTCPYCNTPGRVGQSGAFRCEGCGYTNQQLRPPRQRRRRRRRA